MRPLYPQKLINPFVLTAVFAALLFTAGCTDSDSGGQTEPAASTQPQASTPAASAPTDRTPTGGTLILSASSVTASKGKPVCVAVTARDFQGIVSIQYTMKWDKNVLKFREVKDFGLPGLSATNFGIQLAENGTLTYSWYDPNVQGITKPDGTKLYDVCFEVVGSPGSKTLFQFTDQPTVIEISNSASLFLNLKGEEGTVEVR